MKRDNPTVSRRQHTIAVAVNIFVGGAIGLALGSLGSPLLGLTAALAAGVVLGLANERLFASARWLARWYRLRTVILVLTEALAVIYVVIPAIAAYMETHPIRAAVSGSPADLGLAFEDVRFPTADGLTLSGWYVPSRNGAAILAVHGSNANRAQLLPYARILADQGYGVLMFDLRAHGRSEGVFFPVTEDSTDIHAAAQYLLTRTDVDANRIGAIGLSLGAHVLLQAAPSEPAIGALVVDGASNNRIEDLLPLPAEFRLMYVAAPMWWMHDRFAGLLTGMSAEPFRVLAADIAPRPTLFIASNAQPEPFVNRRLAALAGPGAQLWELPDAGHVGGLFVHPSEYRQRILAFFDAALPSTAEGG